MAATTLRTFRLPERVTGTDEHQRLGRELVRAWQSDGILQVATDVSEDGTVITGWGISPHLQGSKFGQTEPWRAILPAPC